MDRQRTGVRTLDSALVWASASALALGCASPAAPQARALPRGSEASVTPSMSAPAATPPNASASRPAHPVATSTALSPAPSPESARTAFPPAPVTPPFQESARPGDGEWKPIPGLPGSAAGTLVFTTLRPHPVSRFKTLTVAAVDLTQLALAYAPGTADLTEIGSTPALPAPAGLVPAEEQSRLVAVMNASWKPRHGRWGMLFRGVPLVPPRAEGCTLAVRRSGKAALGPWPDLVARHPELEARAPASEDPASAAAADPIVSYRQAPPCLVSRGAVANALLAGNDRAWGGNVPNLVTRRRSAVGLDATGTVLFYGLGEELEPVELARALLAAGAAEAAQLDINWYWTRFLVFGAASGSKESEPGEVPPPPVVVSTLVPGMEHQRTSYVKNASDRDFFYLLRR